jgi:hypothetical protein
MSAVSRHKTSLSGFSGFDIERWKSRAKRRSSAMCNAPSVLRGSEDEHLDIWSSDDEPSTRTTSK